jgi:hypothetical protein
LLSDSDFLNLLIGIGRGRLAAPYADQVEYDDRIPLRAGAPLVALALQAFIHEAQYAKVRTLAAARRGSGRPATGQDIYVEAVHEYLERHAVELKDVAR